MRQHHDMGGQPAGAIDREEHDLSLFDRRVDALMMLLTDSKRKVIRVDELRRGIESLSPEDYDRLTYYQKWLMSMRNLLVEKGVLSEAAIAERVERLRAAGTPGV
jgi:hypothetical protein